jgi:Ca2+-binding EF-hand superfamily protein
MDRDHSGRINRNELDLFLKERGVDSNHRQTIVDELFVKCDQDRNGKIELNEFV